MPLTPLLLLVLLALASAHNATQVISIAQTGCSFLVRNEGSFLFLYCNTPSELALTNWTACIAKCCPSQSYSSLPAPSILSQCQAKDTTPQPFSLTSIIVFAIIAVVALTIFLCFCGIVLKLLKSLYQNRVMQETEDSLTIEWEKEQQFLTTEVGEVKWCRKGRGKGRMIHNDGTCSICLEDASNAQLFCRHTYHPQCIALWLKKSNFCPLCHREDIRSAKIYCPSCLGQYFLCRKSFLLMHSASFAFSCKGCQEGAKGGIEIEDIEFAASQDLIFQFSSEAILSPS